MASGVVRFKLTSLSILEFRFAQAGMSPTRFGSPWGLSQQFLEPLCIGAADIKVFRDPSCGIRPESLNPLNIINEKQMPGYVNSK